MSQLEGLECCQRALGLDSGGKVDIQLESCRFSQLFSLLGSYGSAAAAPENLRLKINSCQLNEIQVGRQQLCLFDIYRYFIFRMN